MPRIVNTKEILPPKGILADVSPGGRAALTGFGQFLEYDKGEHVIEQGTPGNNLTIVVEGELSVSARSTEQIVPLGYTHEGETVGEMGFLEGLEASATVTAAVHSRVWSISRWEFENFLDAHPAAGVEILKQMLILAGHRARKGTERLVEEDPDDDE